MPRQRINKDSFEPAYSQLAAILRHQIAEGIYPPCGKIPAESSISRQYGLSIMTVRQAIGVLTEEGLIQRVQGSGTFVKPISLTSSSFDLSSVEEIFQDSEHTRIKVLKIALARADAKSAAMLQLSPGDRIIHISRLLLRENQPAIFHEGRIRFDPTRPVVEAELSLGPLSDLFNGQGGRLAKKGELQVVPTILSDEEASLLNQAAGMPVFRLEYLVYDFNDTPFGWGWFTAAPEIITLKAKLGLWFQY